jgi:hypothetical protein
LALLTSAVALTVSAQSQPQTQEPPKYQSVAPKKGAPKQADPADVATLTGRPVPPSVAAKPVPRDPAEDNYDPKARKGAPLNPDDVDVLTGKYDEQRQPGYQRYGYAEDLWTLEWMERNGYTSGESFFRADGYGRDRMYLPGVFGRGGRPLFFHHRHRFRGRAFGSRHFLRGGTFVFFP